MFNIGDEVTIISEGSLGIIKNVKKFSDVYVYEVLVNSKTRSFFESQIELKNKNDIAYYSAKDIKAVITSNIINNLDNNSLYSINSAKIDYIPYQFRPVLKIIKSDIPRILIADGVGVGKTIEAGLVIKELQARQDIKSILIICPKPLITENKWSSEMERFGYKFTNLNSQLLNNCLIECDKDGEWPEQYNKCVLPYSLLNEDLLFGKNGKTKRKLGLLDLNPFPNFDVVIVDEAHHIRNQDTFRYKAVKLFLDNCESALLLSATPLQLGNKDLFNLLNLLRPDLVIDYESFINMSEPNQFINRASTIIRKNDDNWKDKVLEQLKLAGETPFGITVFSTNPNYTEIIETLHKDEITNEERVSLIDKIENLHTFSTIINRTRRRDIGSFTVRKPITVASSLTNDQNDLYQKFIMLIADIISISHGDMFIKFMMSTLLRQASSSLFALAPFMNDIINHKLNNIDFTENIENDEELENNNFIFDRDAIKESAIEIINLSKNLNSTDYKLQGLIDIINQKSKLKNNKVMVFSSFRYTLSYIYQNLVDNGIRTAIIHGGVSDEDRICLRERFKLNKSENNAIDVLLFSDVGCEGLDYQFCDCLVNYDIPWNPQKIEQRIGRIDRKGQESESVLIYNLIVNNTIDSEIYNRCLNRIDVFNSMIGDSESIIGELTTEINDIALSYVLNPKEAKEKLNQISDNSIRLIEEQKKLEDNQYAFFGLEVANEKMHEDIEKSTNIFLSEKAIENLISNYLSNKFNTDDCLIGNNNIKTLRLNKEKKSILLNDYNSIAKNREKQYRQWEDYLKNDDNSIKITFNGEAANDEPEANLVNINHPLTKQAIKSVKQDGGLTYLKVKSDKIMPGSYSFDVYMWSYKGLKNNNQIRVISNCQCDKNEFLNLIFNSETYINTKNSELEDLDFLHYQKWQTEKDKYTNEVKSNIEYKKNSLNVSYDKRISIIQKTINSVTDEKIIKMKKSELENCVNKRDEKLNQLDEILNKIDILYQRICRGVLIVEE